MGIGHQRYIACKELGIELIPAIIREELINEDLMLRQLIASNFGRLSNNPSKFRKVVAEYVDLVGKKLGDNQWVSQDDKPKLTHLKLLKNLELVLLNLIECLIWNAN